VGGGGGVCGGGGGGGENINGFQKVLIPLKNTGLEELPKKKKKGKTTVFRTIKPVSREMRPGRKEGLVKAISRIKSGVNETSLRGASPL